MVSNVETHLKNLEDLSVCAYMNVLIARKPFLPFTSFVDVIPIEKVWKIPHNILQCKSGILLLITLTLPCRKIPAFPLCKYMFSVGTTVYKEQFFSSAALKAINAHSTNLSQHLIGILMTRS